MRLGHYSGAEGLRLFAADATGWIDVVEQVPEAPATLDGVIAGSTALLDAIRAGLARAARPGEPGPLAAPLATPHTVLAIGLNYADHCREYGVDPPADMVLFTKHPSSVVGPNSDVVWSTDVTNSVDWEAELGVIIGTPARDVTEAEALEHVFGYTIVNDVTARDIQQVEPQWVRAKSLETFCPIGPVVVTADEVADPQNLTIASRVNGQVMQQSNTNEMIFTVAQIIAHLSRTFTLLPGDVIATGTPWGVGAFRTPRVELSSGDVVEIEVEGLGVLRNTCRVIAHAEGVAS